ncbi:enoyl-CoA hydratase/isomerase family protein [Oryzicola mucosus]|uniref:Enoyl-CoA hydratase/isomerase family protein n=1 Tax=Oryzicola mucosus TaxID=2767425 RepID=A0A8J6PZ36_9HYPH|nr:enoyl-CoA hydratase-related protein [Oryzicola mucosus]MBD0417368.1 enoyl-CoA hydratase/isomerase family protein [Oryzicola mucosus]
MVTVTGESILVERRDDIAIVTLNRLEQMNAFNADMHREAELLWPRLADDRSVRAIVFTGAGKAFSAGGDLKAIARRLGDPQENFRTSVAVPSSALTLFRGLLDLPQPVIAAVNGDAIGLGATLALACDVVVMAETARIGDTHVRVGLVAGDGGAVIWPLLVGPSRAKDFLMRGRLADCNEAFRMGLVGHTAPATGVMDMAVAIASEMAALPPLAVRWTKQSINKQIRQQLELAFDASIAFETITMLSQDYAEAVNGFLEKRKPTFKGE